MPIGGAGLKWPKLQDSVSETKVHEQHSLGLGCVKPDATLPVFDIKPLPASAKLNKEYLPWESAQLEQTGNDQGEVANGLCKPPKGVSDECCLGMSNCFADPRKAPNRQCLSALRTMPSTPGATEAIHAVTSNLQRSKRKLVLTGDSVMEQVYTGLKCAIERTEKYEVEETRELEKYRGVKHDNPSNGGLWWKKDLALRGKQGNASIAMYAQYKPYHDMSQMKDIIMDADVLFMNFGIHYHPYPTNQSNFKYGLGYEMEEYGAMLEKFFDAFASVTSKKPVTLIWRETAAQHFEGKDGEYTGKKGEHQCVESGKGGERDSPIREQVVKEVAEKSHFRVVYLNETLPEIKKDEKILYYVPFHAFSNQFSDLHVGSGDCTHFCQTPMLWQPIWVNLARLLN